jgi:hypothetical protein
MRFFIGTALSLALVLAASGFAAPIKPDLNKLLAEPKDPPAQYVPARAGWSGPESPPRAQARYNPGLESINPAANASAMRSALLALAMPDLRAVAAIALIILLLRRMRNRAPARALSAPKTMAAAANAITPAKAATATPPGEELRPAA